MVFLTLVVTMISVLIGAATVVVTLRPHTPQPIVVSTPASQPWSDYEAANMPADADRALHRCREQVRHALPPPPPAPELPRVIGIMDCTNGSCANVLLEWPNGDVEYLSAGNPVVLANGAEFVVESVDKESATFRAGDDPVKVRPGQHLVAPTATMEVAPHS